MDNYLTVKQLQDLLKVDRITIYRMLQDGRLKGVKIGQQWRFAPRDVEALLSGSSRSEPEPAVVSPVYFPTHCIWTIQNIVSAVAQVGVVSVDLDGQPLTDVSHGCAFCALIQSSPSGRQACRDSWREMAARGPRAPVFSTCHAGLQYAQAPIGVDGESAGWLLSGQFLLQRPSPERAQTVANLANEHGIDPQKLEAASRNLPVLDQQKQGAIPVWLEKVALAVNSILSERAAFMDRLKKITEISSFPS
jgi:excisionase family DNA binding protein